MYMFSVLDLYSIGVGPSSSHTVGPMLATQRFAKALVQHDVIDEVDRVRVTLYGSLALTGLGHGTDRASVAGLEGNDPQTVDTEYLADVHRICDERGTIRLAGVKTITFDYNHDMVIDVWHRLAAHPNGMRCEAFDAQGRPVYEQVWYSVGGGFIEPGLVTDPVVSMHDRSFEAQEDTQRVAAGETDPTMQTDGWPYPFTTAKQLLGICAEQGMSIADVVWANECAIHGADAIRAHLDRVWAAMRASVHEGCVSTQRVLPGGLDVPRRAPGVYARLRSKGDVFSQHASGNLRHLESSEAAWIDLFALAVNEQNAGGGRIVTAPTNGASGVLPATLMYYWHFLPDADEAGVRTFLLTAAAVGYLIKRNASISGAEVGCQGEVGSACSMAAAGLCAVVGGSPAQVENAAEIGMEHHLGLTCDPIGGLVQIPCIERNAVAANTAIGAVRMAMLGDGSHIVTLDQVITTMRQTGHDMMAKYKETSQGGLALNVVEC